MKIIYIGIAVVLLSIGGYFTYRWYKSRKLETASTVAATTTTNTSITSNAPHLVNTPFIHATSTNTTVK